VKEFASNWLPLLGGLALKSLILFLIAGAALLALRRVSASARHLVCLLTLAGLLALPLLSVALPGWRLAVLAAPKDGEPTPALRATPPETGGGRVLEKGMVSTSSPLRFGEGGEERAGRGSPPAPPESGFTGVGAGGVASSPWLSLFLPFWLGGVLLSLLRPLLGLWGIGRLSQSSEPVFDAPTLALASECAAALGLARTPALRSAGAPVPMTWGWRRPVVLLPDGARDWTEGRLRAVLLHELAHVRRRDWLSHRFADLVCALYWFHPLVWLTARRLRAEGEIACDDLVLTAGVAAPDYARHLLDVARALRPIPADTVPQAAVAMARTARIEGRLMMILDTTRPRRALTRRALLTVLGLSAAALVPLALLRPDARAAAPPRPALETFRVTPAAAAFGTAGTIIQLAGIGSPKTQQWWGTDGAPLSRPVFDLAAASRAGKIPDAKESCVLMAFRLPPSAQDVTVSYNPSHSRGFSSRGSWPLKMRGGAGQNEAQLNAPTGGARVLTAYFPASLAATDVRVGTASGPWKVLAAAPGDSSGRSQSLDIQQGDAAYIFSPFTETKEGSVVTISVSAAPGPPAQDLRVVAVDSQGHEILPRQIGDSSIGALDQITAHFELPPARIAALRLESRPFHYVEFKNVAVRPAR